MINENEIPLAPPLLSAERITVSYGKFQAVSDVSITIAAGRGGVGLIGESGSGKTTVARALLGLIHPHAGTIRYRGQDITSLNRVDRSSFRAEVQPVFQDGNEALDPRMRVQQSVMEGVKSRPSRETRASRVAQLLADVGLDGKLATRLPHELSGGQRQRVIIARALALSPKLLILDEPTSALDVTVQARITALLESLGAEHDLSMLLITHNLAIVQQLCATSHVMFAGRIVESGPTTTLMTSPAHPYTRALRDAVPQLGGLPPAASSQMWQPPVDSGCAFRARCPLATEICSAQRPELRAVDKQMVACHHAEKARSTPASAPTPNPVTALTLISGDS